MPNAILHVDMDAFYASVELVRRPELRGQPVIVGGEGRRGVVAAASYEARAYGVHSAMSSVEARRLCPSAVFLAGDHGHYADVSARVMAIFRRYTPLVEPLSLDEAFLDVTGSKRLFGGEVAVAEAIRRDVLAEEQLTCSVGIAPNKFLAKMASEVAKPKAGRDGPRPGLGVKVVEPGCEREFLDPLPVQRLWGVGPKTLARLQRLGVRTIRDVAALPLDALRAAVGDAVGRQLHALSQGRDERTVTPDQQVKSIGHEETYAHDHHDLSTIDVELVRLADAVASRLRKAGVAGRTVSVKVRFSDFTTITRAATLESATSSGSAIAAAAKALVRRVDPTPGVRLLGVSVSKLGPPAPEQPALALAFGEGAPSVAKGRDEVDRAIDEIRDRFGAKAIGPAGLLGPAGMRVKRQGDTQWGPAAPESGAPSTPAARRER